MAGEKDNEEPLDFSGGDEPESNDGGEGAAEPLADEGAPEDAAALAEVIAEEEAVRPRVDPAFQRVNAKLAAAMEENARLQGENKGLRTVAAPAVAAAPVAKVVDIDALEEQAFEAGLLGEKKDVIALRKQINAEIQRRAEEAADKRAAQHSAAAVAQANVEAAERDMADVAVRAVEQYPALDSNNEDERDLAAIAEVQALRDININQRGMRPAAALEAAVKRVAKSYDWDEPAAPRAAVADLGAQRTAAAVKRAAAASNAQPVPLAGGIGARARGSQINPATMTDEQIRALASNKADLKKMMAGEIGG